MNSTVHRGFDVDDERATDILDRAQGATRVDDPRHPRQRAMRALAAIAPAEAAGEVSSGDPTRLGFLVLDRPDEVPTSRVAPRPQGPAVRAGSLPSPGEWLEVEERSASIPMVRAVSDGSLARAACAPEAVPRVIRSNQPPPGPERSVVVHQVSPFGSDARVVAKPKPRRPIPPQGETLPFAAGSDPRVAGTPTGPDAGSPRAPRYPRPPDGPADRTWAEVPGARPDRRGRVVAVGGDVRPQRYMATRIRPQPARVGAASASGGRRALLPLTSALCAVVVAVAALVNVLS